MIESFRSKTAEDLYHGRRTKRVRHFPADLISVALRKMEMLNAAHVMEDLRMPPGNRLELLKRNLAGYHSIRVNDQWRIIFIWTQGSARDVDIVDYHS